MGRGEEEDDERKRTTKVLIKHRAILAHLLDTRTNPSPFSLTPRGCFVLPSNCSFFFLLLLSSSSSSSSYSLPPPSVSPFCFDLVVAFSSLQLLSLLLFLLLPFFHLFSYYFKFLFFRKKNITPDSQRYLLYAHLGLNALIFLLKCHVVHNPLHTATRSILILCAVLLAANVGVGAVQVGDFCTFYPFKVSFCFHAFFFFFKKTT